MQGSEPGRCVCLRAASLRQSLPEGEGVRVPPGAGAGAGAAQRRGPGRGRRGGRGGGGGGSGCAGGDWTRAGRAGPGASAGNGRCAAPDVGGRDVGRPGPGGLSARGAPGPQAPGPLSGQHALHQRLAEPRCTQQRAEAFVLSKSSSGDAGADRAGRCPAGAAAATHHPLTLSCSPERKTLSQREGGRGRASATQPIWEPTLFS